MSPRNIIRKIWDAHAVSRKPGHPVVFAIDLMLIHEVTSAQAFAQLEEKGLAVVNRERLLATLDHSVPTRKDRFRIADDSARAQVETLRVNAQRHGIKICDFESGRQGIVHVIGPELGVTQPGSTIVCGDSHTSTHGAFGALAFGIGSSEVAHVLATGCLLQEEPRSMKVEMVGSFRPGVYAKDAILGLIRQIGIAGATGHAIEYCGDAISRMSMEERMTICNMSIECGARAGLVAPDGTTFEYLRGRPFAPASTEWDRAVETWRSLASDEGCAYDRSVSINLDSLEPMITWGTNPEQAVAIGELIPHPHDLSPDRRAAGIKALQYTGLRGGTTMRGTPIEWAFLGSCTNGRIEDLRVAAEILRSRKIHPRVTFFVVPGSEQVRAQAIEEGLDRIFEEAGAQFRMPGCSMCLGMNDDRVPAGQRCISSSNRNFVGRQGKGSFTHLASPATVAASAVAGEIMSINDIQ